MNEEEVTQLREWWLYHAAQFLLEMIAAAGVPTVPVRVSCGWPSSGGLGEGAHVIGECAPQLLCADGVAQIFISPRIAESIEVLGTLLHELIHAVDRCEHGHRKEFSQLARRLGLVGPPTATQVGPQLAPLLQGFVEQAGPYPHAPIVIRKKERGGSRLRLYQCQCPDPVKLRAGRDDLNVLCLECETVFAKVEQEG